MAWIAPAVSAGAQVGGTILDFIGKQQDLAQKQRAIDAADRNAGLQNYLAFRGLNLQQEMAQAGQTDVYGNKLIYDPASHQWVTMTSPEGQALINRSDAIQRNADIRNLTTGQDERTLALDRRVAAGEGANALLTQFARGYGAPTKEGVVGTNKVAAATGSGEKYDAARSGFAAAGLRSGMIGDEPTGTTMANIDRAGATGLRTALAQDYSPIFNEMKANFASNTLNPRGSLAGESSAPDIPYTPSSLPTSLGNDALNRAARGSTAWNPYTGYAANTASNALVNAIGARTQPGYGGLLVGLGDTLSTLYKSIWGKNSASPGDAVTISGGNRTAPGDTF